MTYLFRRVAQGGWLLVALLGLAGSCTADGPAIPTDPIRIGVVVSLSGGLASVGPHLAESAEQAVLEVNAAGGLLGGRPVEVVVIDDRTTPEGARRAAQQLIEDDQVVAIVGSLASSATLEVQDVAFNAGIPQVSCCSTSVALDAAQPAGNRFLFRTVASDQLQAEVVARYAIDESCDRLAILHIDDEYGNPFAASIAGIFSSLASEGQTVVPPTPFSGGESGYSDEVSTVRDQLASVGMAERACIALVGFPADGGRILRDWNSLSDAPDVLWIATDGLRDSGFPEAAGGASIVDGVTGTAPVVQPQTESYNDFESNFEASFGELPGIFGAQQYDATIMLMLAIEAARSTDGTAIRDALFSISRLPGSNVEPKDLRTALSRLREGSEINYTGASGDVDFDTLGNVIGDYEIWRFDAGDGGTEDAFSTIGMVRASELGQQ
ncbi:MAG: ABC transporter substrate-binding protein [Myxococcota bacterium]